jgi:hypothetical protein
MTTSKSVAQTRAACVTHARLSGALRPRAAAAEDGGSRGDRRWKMEGVRVEMKCQTHKSDLFAHG